MDDFEVNEKKTMKNIYQKKKVIHKIHVKNTL